MWAAGLTLWLYYTDLLLKMPGGLRIAFLVVALVILVVVAARSLFYPLSRTISDADLALLVEREYPLLNDRLISSLQMLKSQERYKDAASEDMIRAVVGESFDIAGRLRFNEAPAAVHGDGQPGGDGAAVRARMVRARQHEHLGQARLRPGAGMADRDTA
jgi:hypothetical protein